MFTSTDRLEANKGNLHGQNEAKDIETGVSYVEADGVASCEAQYKDVQRNKVDDKYVASPCGHHIEVGQRT